MENQSLDTEIKVTYRGFEINIILDHTINTEEIAVHSVKRESDGKIFWSGSGFWYGEDQNIQYWKTTIDQGYDLNWFDR